MRFPARYLFAEFFPSAVRGGKGGTTSTGWISVTKVSAAVAGPFYDGVPEGSELYGIGATPRDRSLNPNGSPDAPGHHQNRLRVRTWDMCPPREVRPTVCCEAARLIDPGRNKVSRASR